MSRHIGEHTRVNDILLGPLERRALNWLVVRAPGWVTPDLCTAVGAFGAVVAMIGYATSRFSSMFLWLASLGWMMNWLGDSLDGNLARYRKIERPRYGFFLDHMADVFNEMIIMVGVGLSPYVRLDVAVFSLVVYLLLSVLCFIRLCIHNEFMISFWRLGPTEMRVAWILFNTVAFFAGPHAIRLHHRAIGVIVFSAYDLTVMAVALFLLVMFITSVVHDLKILAAGEPEARPCGSDRPPGAGET